MDSTSKMHSIDEFRETSDHAVSRQPEEKMEGRDVNKLSEEMSDMNLDQWKQDVMSGLRVLSVKISAAGTREEIIAAGSDVESILDQLEPIKAETNESQKRKIGISLLESLNNALYANIGRLGRNTDFLDLVVNFGTRAISFLPKGHSGTTDWYFNLGQTYRFRYDLSRAADDLDASIKYLAESLAMTPRNNPKIIMRLDTLGRAYSDKCQCFPEFEVLTASIENLSSAISLAVQGELTIPSVLNYLGGLYLLRSHINKGNELDDIDKAKEYYTHATNHAQETENYPIYLHNLGRSFHLRFKRLGRAEDINTAVDSQIKALEMTHSNDSNLASRLHSLGDTYQTRFASFGSIEDCDHAIGYHEQALSLAPESTPNRACYLSSLGNSYMERFIQLGETEDIKKAIEYQTQAISLTRSDDPDLFGRLNNAGISFRSRFNRFGFLDDLDKAIEYQEMASHLAMKVGRELSSVLFNLGDSYQVRFLRLRRKPDLEYAIGLQVRAVNLTPDSHPNKSNLLDSLGVSCALRFSLKTMLGSLDDINKAIEYQTLAVQLASQKHIKLHTFLSNLSLSYQTRFKHGDPASREDIDAAIEWANQAVGLTPDENTDKYKWLTNLGNAYADRFHLFQEPEDLDRALEAHARAISLAPDGHQLKATLFMNLAISYLHQYKQSENQQALDHSINYLRKAVECQGGHPGDKFSAARLCASLLSSNHRPGAIEAYQVAINWLHRVTWLGDLTATTYYHIFQVNDFFAEAAATAIHGQEYHLALEWVEEGRSIVWRQLLQLKAPVDDLASINPTLAEDIKQVADELYNTITETTASPVDPSKPYLQSQNYYFAAVPKHHRLVYRYDALIEQARKTPGFENFMRPKKGPELAQCAKSGPVVIITAHQSRCDALILLPNQINIKHVPLPNLFRRPALKLYIHNRENSLHTWNIDELTGYRGIRLRAKPDQFEIMLADLWECVARPVLEALGYLASKMDDLPHIIWSITGPLSFLPFHAAGDYSKPRMRLFNFAVSSYNPMLSVLLRPQPPSHIHSRIVAIGQEATLGQALLPCTKEELDSIKSHTKAPVEFTQLEGHKATATAAESAMQECDWIHLACHATPCSYNPMASAFWLHESKLELRQIIQNPLKNKGLAYLSACQTAAGEEPLPNESAHLASGMLIAGYYSVIATIWGIFDKDAPLVADKVYAQLIKDGQMDYTQSAMALHKATGELRQKVGEKEFARWVPFIHIGL
ncbi:unnamed protein product [Rhizoctonia solani]|uniref:CHAT domain-containing protein n=1 Tax=Rhizoctonia solani TaxID=456999 RepID=A0A8H3CTS1_9AGAM|nr:unnamed protein product [Rhizoctonia solani]